jgi:hypothetical protein
MSSKKKNPNDVWGVQKPEDRKAVIARLKDGLNQISARRAEMDGEHALAFPESDAPQPAVDAPQPFKDVFLPPVNLADYAESEAGQEEDPAAEFHALFPSREEEPEVEEPQPEGHPVQLENGEITFVLKPEEDETYILVKTAEVQEIISASTSWQTRTGRYLHSWRLRKLPEEAGLEFVWGEPNVPRREPERVSMPNWGEGGRRTWRSGDPDNPSPATRRPSYIEEFGRFVIGQRNRDVPGN